MGYGNDCFREDTLQWRGHKIIFAVARLWPSDLYHKASGLRQDAAKY